VAPSLHFFFFNFAVVVVLYLLVAFSHIPSPPFPSEFYFSAQKNLTSIPKKDETTETQI